jgi:hypothetical protein
MLSLALASLIPASARALPVQLQAGLSVGWMFGRGFTIGPVLSGGGHLATGRPFNASWDTWLIGGVVVAGDVTFGAAGGPPTYRLHVGPEIATWYQCPVFFAPLSAGLEWSFAKGRPARLGGTASVAFLLSRHAAPTYVVPARAPTITFGPEYRLSIAVPKEVEHTLAVESRVLLYPNVGVGDCVGD